jgi:high affinity sulfate transporter 1
MSRPVRTRGITRWIPGVRVISTYRPGWLPADLMAGVVLTALLLPQGMAYAELAGLPAVTGLYATMLPLIAYFVFGPSRILVLGPDSAVSPVVAAAVIPLAGASVAARMETAAMLALLVGAILLIGAVLGLGFITDLISKPVRIGSLAGIAVTVLVTQFPKLLGIPVSADSFVEAIRQLPGTLGESDPLTLAIGAGCLALILVLRRTAPRVPGVFIAVAGATLLVAALGLADQIAVVGTLPSGLPSLTVPGVSADDLGRLTLSALAVALVAFADTSVLSRSYATKLRQSVDQDQELLALGAANVVTGLFQGFPLSSSSSRTPVAEAAGARTQVTGVVAAVAVAIVLVVGAGLTENLPQAALAAVVMAAVIGLVDVPALRWLARVNRIDFALAIAAFVGVVLFGVLIAIAIAIGLSALAFLWRSWHPYDAVLGRVTGRKGYHDVGRHPDAATVPGLVLYRFDAPLFFANAGVFHERLLRAMEEAPQPVRWVVVAAEPITDVDTTAADMLIELSSELKEGGVELVIAEMKGPPKDKLAAYGLLDLIGEQRFFSTVGAAVHAYVNEHGVEWRDWEDDQEPDEGSHGQQPEA